MAEFEFNFFTFITKGSEGTPNEVGVQNDASAFDASVTDKDPNSTTFEVGDNLITNGIPTGSGAFAGTVTLGGETFLLIEGPDSTYLGIASVPDPSNFDVGEATFPESAINTDPTLVCFAAGTLIATPGGETAVEALKIGDTLLTQDGRTVPVKWIGRQTVHKIFTPAERFVPVRVTAGALGGGLPHTDLVVTADHALIIDDLAINASALVNDTTITSESIDSLPDRVTYYHIETENHDVVLANGTPTETFVDYIGRQAFDNHAEYEELYGPERAITEMNRPRVSAKRLLPPQIRARLAGRIAA
ncbi:Hint domain-containing protein [Sedimentitalea todarodis]|uniref:Hint domain-containing protein n=1 Tax=Sedimentitalea todarodis TaxID=1631240 RepID=A0ABU3VE69_9RHOB|nr:Hint domain-containing protein [Sedimentitalea todarodis]MDU9004315.1 Hint domain-containing protein [Sedimentitalea todarodis]